MQRDEVGRYVTRWEGGEVVRAYVPHPLPPTPPLEYGQALHSQLEKATLALGRLDSITVLLPNPQLFLYTYVRREAVLSSQIEGTQSSLSDLLLFELDEAPGVPQDDVVEVSNYVAALEHGLARLQEGFPLCNRLLREMHFHLLSRGRGATQTPGEFRRSQNWIGGTRPGNALFVPPPPDEVEHCMAALEQFIHDKQNALPILVKVALLHVQFETIHPFLDGNGRLGRLLIALLLYEAKILGQPLLYLSLYFKQHRARYYELLNHVRATGDWEAWVAFFLEGVEETASGAVQTARRLVSLFQRDTERLPGGRGASNLLRVFNALRGRPVCNLKQLCHDTRLPFPTAAKAMQTLIELGIARELTGQRRNRVFVYDDYLNALNESL